MDELNVKVFESQVPNLDYLYNKNNFRDSIQPHKLLDESD